VEGLRDWFLSLSDARRTIENWRVSYNTARARRALGHVRQSKVAMPQKTAYIFSPS